MKAIIISNEDARALLDQLELRAMRERNLCTTNSGAIDEAHRAFHFVVVRWLQAQGADVLRS